MTLCAVEVTCPRCGSVIGQRCRTLPKSGVGSVPTSSHRARLVKHRETSRVTDEPAGSDANSDEPRPQSSPPRSMAP